MHSPSGRSSGSGAATLSLSRLIRLVLIEIAFSQLKSYLVRRATRNPHLCFTIELKSPLFKFLSNALPLLVPNALSLLLELLRPLKLLVRRRVERRRVERRRVERRRVERRRVERRRVERRRVERLRLIWEDRN